jgi:probable HAF family extracellular repeat protein
VKVTATDDDSASASREAGVDVRQGAQPAGYEPIDVGTLGGESSRPSALNDNDAVVGTSTTPSGELHAFLWKDGSIRDLATGFFQSRAEKITRDGVIAGVGFTAENGASVFQWKNGVTTNLGRVGIAGGPQVAITGALGNDVLAWHESEMDRFTSAIWRSGARQSIGGLYSPSSDEAEAMAMNDSRQVVGASLIYGGLYDIYHAFLWENGTSRDLGVLQDFTCDVNGGYPTITGSWLVRVTTRNSSSMLFSGPTAQYTIWVWGRRSRSTTLETSLETATIQRRVSALTAASATSGTTARARTSARSAGRPSSWG